MSPMPHKSAFEPKDPRIINLYEDDDDEDELDDWSLTTTSDVTPRPRRKKTGTQALVEFLNTTSPEEFEKKSPKRTSNLFFRRRNKNKPPTAPSSTSSTPTPSTTSSYLTSFNSRHDVVGSGTGGAAPNTIHRKNYIEIIPNHIANPILSREASSSTSLTRVASRTPSLASRQSAVIRRSVISNSDQQQASQQNQNPLLPSNRSIKQRESSLYSDSIRHSMSTKSHSLRGTRPLMRHDTDATLGTKSSVTSGMFQRRTSEHTFGGQMEQQGGSSVVGSGNNGPSAAATATDLQHPHAPPNQQQLEERDRKATETLVSHFASQDDLETVESALLQRLERFRLSKMDRPSDVVAAGLATEHVRALQASTQEYEVFDHLQQPFDLNNSQEQQKTTRKKVRHMQVQTMPLESLSPSKSNEVSSSSSINNSNSNEASSSSIATSPTASTTTDNSSNNNRSSSSSSSHTAVISTSTSTGTTSDDPVIAQLQQQLAEEQKQRKRLEAALEETCDHFEVLSGLAYKKLRELWEERTRWENACIELRDRLLEINQGPSSMEDLDDFPNSEYVVEEEKEDDHSK